MNENTAVTPMHPARCSLCGRGILHTAEPWVKVCGLCALVARSDADALDALTRALDR